MTEIMRGRVPRNVDLFQSFTEHLGVGLVATGMQYSPVATVGTTAVEVFNTLINPGVNLTPKEIEINLCHKFTELTGGTTAGSLCFYWQGRQESVATTRAYIPLTGTINQSAASGAIVTGSLFGYFPVASLPQAPVRIRMMAQALYTSAFAGCVSNVSYVKLVGMVIPGA